MEGDNVFHGYLDVLLTNLVLSNRHRLTSLLVAVFLKNWFRSPHKLSLDYIWSLTGHRVTVDENGLAERENPSNWTTSLNYAAYTDLFDVLLDGEFNGPSVFLILITPIFRHKHAGRCP